MHNKKLFFWALTSALGGFLKKRTSLPDMTPMVACRVKSLKRADDQV